MGEPAAVVVANAFINVLISGSVITTKGVGEAAAPAADCAAPGPSLAPAEAPDDEREERTCNRTPPFVGVRGAGGELAPAPLADAGAVVAPLTEPGGLSC